MPCEGDTETADRRQGASIRNASPQWPSKIVLIARIGKGIVGVDVPVLLKEVSFFARLRVQLNLMPSLPIVKSMQLAFVEQPRIEFVLKPLKAFDLMDLPGLSNWLYGMINESLGSTMVDPSHLDIDLTPSLRDEQGAAKGVLKLTVFQVRGIRDAEELYVEVHVGGKAACVTEKLEERSFAWNQSFFLPLSSFKTPVTLMLMNGRAGVLATVPLPVESQLGEQGVRVWRGAEGAKYEVEVGWQFFVAEDEVAEDESDTDVGKRRPTA